MPSSSLFLRSSTTLVSTLALLSAPVLSAPTSSQVYNIDTTYAGPSFFSGWNFFADADPTHGFVTYLSQSQAQSAQLISAGSSAKMLVDSTTVLPAPANNSVYWGQNGVGRKSVRIESQKSWTHGLFVVDLNHMPTSSTGGCGTWPAFWTLGSGPWPNNGEIDIIEGANDQPSNYAAGHTARQCSVTNRGGSGELKYANCNYNDIDPWGNAKNPTGCQAASRNPQSWGSAFNSIGGGVYAMEWTSEAIKIWFFPKGGVPSDLSTANPDPSGWGQPFTYWDNSGCNIDANYNDLRIVFDTTFCGDFGDATWSTGTCASRTRTASCAAYVAQNPSDFASAYWDVNYVKVFKLGAAQQTTTTTTRASTTTTSAVVTTTTTSYYGNATTTSGNYTRPVPTTTTTTAKWPVDPDHTDPSKPWEDSDDVSTDPSKPCKKCSGNGSVDPDHTDPSQPWLDSDEVDSDPSKPCKNKKCGSDGGADTGSDSSQPWTDSSSSDPSQQWSDSSSSDPSQQWSDSTNSGSKPGQQWSDTNSSPSKPNNNGGNDWQNVPAPADPAKQWADQPASPVHTAHLEPVNGGQQQWSDNKPAAPAADPAQQWSDAPVAPASQASWSDVPAAPTSAITIKVIPTQAAETWADADKPVAPATGATGGAAKPTAAAPVAPAETWADAAKPVAPYTGGASARGVVAWGVMAVAGVVGAALL